MSIVNEASHEDSLRDPENPMISYCEIERANNLKPQGGMVSLAMVERDIC